MGKINSKYDEGGEGMQQAAQNIQALPQKNSKYEHITTTLYDLIEAINEELQPEEEDLLGRIVFDLAENQRIKFIKNSLVQRRSGHEENGRIVSNR